MGFNGYFSKYPFVIVCLVLAFACTMAKGRLFRPDVETINANPSILNHKHISGGKLDGLEISNAQIKGMVMEDVDAEWAEIKNITFENCTFIRVFMLNSHFENVAFKNCRIENKGTPEELLNRTIFSKSTMKNVLFENTKLHNVDMTEINGKGGYIFFKNMKEVYPPRGIGSIFAGGNLHVRIKNSTIDLAHFIASDKNKLSSFYAKNCEFKKPHIKSDHLYIEQCDVTEGSLVSYKKMVVKNSSIRFVTFNTNDKAYLLNNIYENNEGDTLNVLGYPLKQVYRNSAIAGRDHSHTYILQQGTQKESAHLNFKNGSVTIENLKLYDVAYFPGPASADHPIKEINLRNVEILDWSPWAELHLLGGKWENVKIHGPILVKNTKIENVQAYNLTFPKGEPWQKEGEFVFDVTKSPKPFEWEEIKVPTPEDLGLEWWPMEPGYHPEK